MATLAFSQALGLMPRTGRAVSAAARNSRQLRIPLPPLTSQSIFGQPLAHHRNRRSFGNDSSSRHSRRRGLPAWHEAADSPSPSQPISMARLPRASCSRTRRKVPSITASSTGTIRRRTERRPPLEKKRIAIAAGKSASTRYLSAESLMRGIVVSCSRPYVSNAPSRSGFRPMEGVM